MMLPKRPLISASLIACLLTPAAYAQPPKSTQSATTTPPGHPSTPTPAPRTPASAKPAPPVWRSFHLDPNVRLKLDFRHASADVVIQTLSDASRIPIVKDPDLVGDITLRTPAPVSLDDAFALLEISLHLQHCQLAKSGKFLTVIRLPIVVTAPPSASVHMAAPPAGAMPGMPGMPPGMQGMPGGMSGGMPGMPGMPGGSPPSGGSAKDTEMQFKIYPIKYASATLVAKVINDIYNQTPPPQMPGMPQFQQPQPAGPNDKKVKADGEEYSNSLVVWAPAKDQADIAGFVAQIDKPATEQRTSRVFKLKHALANKVAPIIQSIVDNSNPTGRGHTSPAATQSQNPFVVFFGQGQKQTDNGDVVPDIRTNTLTVTAAVEVLARIDDVLKDLDQPASFQSSTFVYVFKNARADVVANLLNVSFGNRINNGSVGGALTTALSTNNQPQPTGDQPPGLTTQTNQQQSNQTTTNGVLSITRGSNTGSSTPDAGLDAEGNVTNIRDLTGQALLVPNIDTNSVIVMAQPADWPLIKQILEQLDVVPEQVMIETLVVEATLDRTDQLGIEWNFNQNGPFRVTGATGVGSTTLGSGNPAGQPQGFTYTLTMPAFSAVLKALRTDKRFNVISSPRVFTTNNALAQVKIGQSLPYITNQTTQTTGATLSTYNFLDVGLVLTLIPRIMSNGCVTMDVTQTANDFVGYTSFNAPIVNERETQTTVNVKDGETAVLGGIIQHSTNATANKVPILGDLPLVGPLFRSTSTSKNKTELLIFLTPHVIHDPTELAKEKAQALTDIDPKSLPATATLTTPAPSTQP